MKKFIVLFALMSFLFSSAMVLADTNPVPEDAQSALKAALADPPVSPSFLIDVYNDEDVVAYMRHAPIVVNLGEKLKIYFSEEAGVYVQLIDDCGTAVSFSGDVIDLSCKRCEDENLSCCTKIQNYLWEHRQSDFWTALVNAVQIGVNK